MSNNTIASVIATVMLLVVCYLSAWLLSINFKNRNYGQWLVICMVPTFLFTLSLEVALHTVR